MRRQKRINRTKWLRKFGRAGLDSADRLWSLRNEDQIPRPSQVDSLAGCFHWFRLGGISLLYSELASLPRAERLRYWGREPACHMGHRQGQ